MGALTRALGLGPALEQRAASDRIPGPTEVDSGLDAWPDSLGSLTPPLIDAYACISLLVDSVSMLPIGQFRRGDKTREPVASPSPLLTNPDPDLPLGWIDWCGRIVHSLAARGNAYAIHLDRDGLGYPTVSRVVHPDDIRPVKAKTGRKEFEVSAGRTLDAADVLHIPYITPPGSMKGISPISAGRRGLSLAQHTERFGELYFRDGNSPSSVLETEQPMEDTEALRQQARWIAARKGNRKVAVLSGGLKWRPVSIAPNESQFIETRQLNTSQIARLWRIPPHMIGDVARSTSWGTGIEEQGIGYVVFTLGPYIARLEAALNSVTPRGNYCRVNFNALLRGNAKDRMTAYAIGRQWGWLSVNDIRALEDLPPIGAEGDIYLTPLNMADAEAALKDLLNPPAPKGQPA